MPWNEQCFVTNLLNTCGRLHNSTRLDILLGVLEHASRADKLFFSNIGLSTPFKVVPISRIAVRGRRVGWCIALNQCVQPSCVPVGRIKFNNASLYHCPLSSRSSATPSSLPSSIPSVSSSKMAALSARYNHYSLPQINDKRRLQWQIEQQVCHQTAGERLDCQQPGNRAYASPLYPQPRCLASV